MPKTQKLPMVPGFRRLGGASCFIRICEALPEHMRAGTREVFRLGTAPSHRKKGYATTLMHSVCREADSVNMALVLMAQPFGQETGEIMDYEALTLWYEAEFGFQMVQKDIGLMVRAPGASPKIRMRLDPVTKTIIESVR